MVQKKNILKEMLPPTCNHPSISSSSRSPVLTTKYCLDRNSPEFLLDYSGDFQKLEDLQPYPFREIYQERTKKNL